MGSPQVINCTVNTVSGVKLNSVKISWMGPGGGSFINDSRVTISAITFSGNNYIRSLQFNYLMEGDEGTYTCNVMILETSASHSVAIQSLISKLLLHLLNHVHAYLKPPMSCNIAFIVLRMCTNQMKFCNYSVCLQTSIKSYLHISTVFKSKIFH